MASNVKRDHHTWTRDTIKNVSGNVTLDLTNDLIIDVDGGDVHFEDAEAKIAKIGNILNSGSLYLYYVPDDSYYLYAQTDADGASIIGTTSGSAASLSLNPTGDLKLNPTTNNVRLGATEKLIFTFTDDDTYISESSDDVLDFYVGDVNMLQLNEATGINVVKGDTRLLDSDASPYSGTHPTSVQTKAQIDTAIAVPQSQYVQTAEITITEAEMSSLSSTPKELVAAQGQGKVVIPIRITLFVDRAASITQLANSVFYISAGTDAAKTWASVKSFMRLESGDRIITPTMATGENCQTLTGMDDVALTAATTLAITNHSIDECKVVVQYYVYDNG